MCANIIRKKVTVIAMKLKTPKVNVRTNSASIDRFDLEDIEQFFKQILSKPPVERKMNIQDAFIFLESVDDSYNDRFYTGWFTSARYGDAPDWLDVNTVIRRTNNKAITEGEENFTYFLLDKQTGLFLVQFDSKRIVNGDILEQYFRYMTPVAQDYIKQYNKTNHGHLLINSALFTQLDYSVETTFMQEVRALARIKQTKVKCSVAAGASNSVITAMQNTLDGVDNYDQVEFSVINTRRLSGIRAIEGFIEGLQENDLYRNVTVIGTTQSGGRKLISWENHSKKFDFRAIANSKGLFSQDDMISNLIKLALQQD